MTGLSDAHHFRKMVAGFCMVFAPLLLLVAAGGSPGDGHRGKLDDRGRGR